MGDYLQWRPILLQAPGGLSPRGHEHPVRHLHGPDGERSDLRRRRGGEGLLSGNRVILIIYLMMKHNIRETVVVLCPMRAMASTSSSVMSATETAVLRYWQCRENEKILNALFLGWKIRSLWQNLFLQNMDRRQNVQPQVLRRDCECRSLILFM